jgi:dTDP-4-amino-4,6-dideoxy-D-galactose acyltransferase
MNGKLPDWLGDAMPELVRDYLDPAPAARAKHFAAALARCDANGRLLQVVRNGAAVAVAGVERLAWDSKHFGTGWARLAPVCVAPDASLADRRACVAEIADAAIAWCAEEGISILLRRIVGARSEEASVFEQRGFQLVDSIVTLTAPAAAQKASSAVRPAQQGDREALLAIAETAFPHSRFLADPMLDALKARLVYVRWLETLLSGTTIGDKSGAGGIVLVAEFDGRPGGFIAMRRDSDLDVLAGRPIAAMEMFAVAEKARGRGLGTALLSAACDWSAQQGADLVEASTWTAATAARSSYHRAGYAIRDTLLTFHGRVS